MINTFGRTQTIDIAHGVGRTVDAVRVSPNGRFVYVGTSDADSGTLLVVDAAKGRVTREVPVASPIRDVALSRDGALVYVASFDTHWGGSVDIIDTAINEITAKVGIGGAPMQMALSSDGRRLYIADYEHVAVLCTETNSVIDTLTVTAEPSCVAVSPDSTSAVHRRPRGRHHGDVRRRRLDRTRGRVDGDEREHDSCASEAGAGRRLVLSATGSGSSAGLPCRSRCAG